MSEQAVGCAVHLSDRGVGQSNASRSRSFWGLRLPSPCTRRRLPVGFALVGTRRHNQHPGQPSRARCALGAPTPWNRSSRTSRATCADPGRRYGDAAQPFGGPLAHGCPGTISRCSRPERLGQVHPGPKTPASRRVAVEKSARPSGHTGLLRCATTGRIVNRTDNRNLSRSSAVNRPGTTIFIV
jgi:hypothetical protein